MSWSHYRLLIHVDDSKAREWYQKEAYEQTWSSRTLQRNINTQYYYRLLQSQNKSAVETEMKEKTFDYQNDKLEFVKNPIIAEFMGLSSNTDMTESDLETAILNNYLSMFVKTEYVEVSGSTNNTVYKALKK